MSQQKAGKPNAPSSVGGTHEIEHVEPMFTVTVPVDVRSMTVPKYQARLSETMLRVEQGRFWTLLWHKLLYPQRQIMKAIQDQNRRFKSFNHDGNMYLVSVFLLMFVIGVGGMNLLSSIKDYEIVVKAIDSLKLHGPVEFEEAWDMLYQYHQEIEPVTVRVRQRVSRLKVILNRRAEGLSDRTFSWINWVQFACLLGVAIYTIFLRLRRENTLKLIKRMYCHLFSSEEMDLFSTPENQEKTGQGKETPEQPKQVHPKVMNLLKMPTQEELCKRLPLALKELGPVVGFRTILEPEISEDQNGTNSHPDMAVRFTVLPYQYDE